MWTHSDNLHQCNATTHSVAQTLRRRRRRQTFECCREHACEGRQLPIRNWRLQLPELSMSRAESCCVKLEKSFCTPSLLSLQRTPTHRMFRHRACVFSVVRRVVAAWQMEL